jgi:transcription initiation factor TFIIIB Brf1 subunit/transcription initiation factor TFIIB
MSNRNLINIADNFETYSTDSYKDDFHDYAKVNNLINRKNYIIEQEEENEFDSYDNYEKYNQMIDMMYADTEPKNTKEIHNGPWCDDCQNDDIIEDTSHGILVCKNCGQVVSNLLDTQPEWTQFADGDKKESGRNSSAISRLLPQSSIATTISGSCSSRIKTLHGWSAMPYKERSLNEVFKMIQLKCFEGKILRCIEDDAKIMYKNISDCKHLMGKNKDKNIIIRGVNRKSLIAACVLFACRKKDKTRSPKEIAELFGLKYTEITKGCKTFLKLAKLKHMEIKFSFTKPEHFITRFCDELKIKKEYAEQAIQISNNVQKLHIASVHTPLSLATGSIYLMIILNGFNIQKRTIADKFNVSQVTIAKAFKKLEPFINILTNDKMCDQLSKEIIKYQENIEITDELKPKFIRFGVNVNSTNYSDNPLSIYDPKTHEIKDKLIVEHNIEFINKNYQLEAEYMRLRLNFVDDVYKIISNNQLAK